MPTLQDMSQLLYGLGNASHDFSKPESLGKNIFTNAFPLAIAQYLAIERGLPIPLIKAVTKNGRLSTVHDPADWQQVIGTDPANAHFQFEGVFEGYNAYTHTSANKSDVVALERPSMEHSRPLEIKLVVVPTSGTANKSRADQSCEIVVRPSTVEQIAFSIAHSYGVSRRAALQDIIRTELGQPNDYKWKDEASMLRKMPQVLRAAERIAEEGLDLQTPLVLTAVWRTDGQRPNLDEHAFDAFCWTDMAFMQLFTDATRSAFFDSRGRPKAKTPKKISRHSRALVWLVNSLWDYTTQGTLNFGRIHSEITYGTQSDKAASFSGKATLKHLSSPEFLEPRVKRGELEEILDPSALSQLLPERRLDAAIFFQHLLNQKP